MAGQIGELSTDVEVRAKREKIRAWNRYPGGLVPVELEFKRRS